MFFAVKSMVILSVVNIICIVFVLGNSISDCKCLQFIIHVNFYTNKSLILYIVYN